MLEKRLLEEYYVHTHHSVAYIASELRCSENKVNYWLRKHGIPKRSISEAQYVKHNPKGDPFSFVTPTTQQQWFLFGIGLGLWWGEGNKSNRTSLRLGNTDPDLLKYFLLFLRELFQIDVTRLRFGLQIFTDIDPVVAQQFWCRTLHISPSQFQKVVVSKSVARGTYRKKSEYGVLTIYFSNTKIRDSIYRAIETLRTTSYANVAQLVERIHGGSH